MLHSAAGCNNQFTICKLRIIFGQAKTQWHEAARHRSSLKILTIEKEELQFKDLTNELLVSSAEISESLNRSQLAGLVSEDERKVARLNILEFNQYGLHYVLPQTP